MINECIYMSIYQHIFFLTYLTFLNLYGMNLSTNESVR